MSNDNTNLTDDLKQKVIKWHDATCKMAHEDQCAWYYEVDYAKKGVDAHNWNGWTHQHFLKDYLKNNPN